MLPQGGITLDDIYRLCVACTRDFTVMGELGHYTQAEVDELKWDVLSQIKRLGPEPRVLALGDLTGGKEQQEGSQGSGDDNDDDGDDNGDGDASQWSW